MSMDELERVARKPALSKPIMLLPGDMVMSRADTLALIARVRAAEGEVARLREDAEERESLATAKALQAAAQLVLDAESHAFDEVDEAERDAFLDDLANDILELSADEIDRINAAQEAEHDRSDR